MLKQYKIQKQKIDSGRGSEGTQKTELWKSINQMVKITLLTSSHRRDA